MKTNSGRRLQSTESQSQSINGHAGMATLNNKDSRLVPTQKVAPTQRLSEVGDSMSKDCLC
jgi:hypothetical protein